LADSTGAPPSVVGDAAVVRRIDPRASVEDEARAALLRLAPGTTALLGLRELGRDGVYPLRSYEPIASALPQASPSLDEFLGVQLRAMPGGLARLATDPSPLRAVAARPGGEDPRVVVAALGDPRSLLERGVPVPTAIAEAAPGACAPRARVELVGWRAHELSARVEADCAVVLVHLTSLVPGWTAEIDGSPARLVAALGAYQAVVVPPGGHDVRFSYWPAGLAAGAPVSAAGLLAVLLLAMRRPRPRGAEERVA
jgi:hypothetical protein